MSVYIGGFICALVLAAIVVVWIVYCMFIRERHKSEFYHYNISDLQRRQYELSEETEKEVEKKEITAGIFILPSRRKQKDEDYDKRPDYPESPVHCMETGTEQLIEIFNDNAVDIHYRDGIIEIDSNSPYHSEV
ncbi:uncharacterized protein LOC114363426 [Ostrinia furnacalis]|uniref:uncharacterized protein LOC114363426 n=1 Tax=Ostrinia furnacalis TaxID=93504 RepID=UPI001038D06C|nr:uncharacterized protein LOC114363426 [Ostrinia furnacalis]